MRFRSLSILFLAALPLVQDHRTVHAPDKRVARPGVGEPGGSEHLLGPDDLAKFERGRALFAQSLRKSAGLGAPEMNADSCRACHQDPVNGGAGALELNVSRFGSDHGGAGPFEDLPGGQVLSKLRPPTVAGREEYPATEADVFEQRQAPSILGDGLIQRISEAEILANEDPDDRNGDGIRGRARRREIAGATEIGRFGWKAQVPRLADFVRDALGGELGLTTSDDGRGFALTSDSDLRSDPELDDASADDLAFYLDNLAAPRRLGSTEPEVLLGELLFERIGCAKCHVPELTGPSGPVPLYSDLLLHDVWPARFRGMSEEGAGPGVYRTAPLWGVRTTAPYLHDGRAATLRQAIVAHDGEALAVRQRFQTLAPSDQGALVAFLNDL
jgi:CxxC motif-containing protein (DUF1111 family)